MQQHFPSFYLQSFPHRRAWVGQNLNRQLRIFSNLECKPSILLWTFVTFLFKHKAKHTDDNLLEIHFHGTFTYSLARFGQLSSWEGQKSVQILKIAKKSKVRVVIDKARVDNFTLVLKTIFPRGEKKIHLFITIRS